MPELVAHLSVGSFRVANRAAKRQCIRYAGLIPVMFFLSLELTDAPLNLEYFQLCALQPHASHAS